MKPVKPSAWRVEPSVWKGCLTGIGIFVGINALFLLSQTIVAWLGVSDYFVGPFKPLVTWSSGTLIFSIVIVVFYLSSRKD